jgi:hypothetical protein
MGRIETYSFRNFQPRKPNHSFFNSEKVQLTGNPVSASNFFSFRPIKYDINCPTTKFEASSINTQNLSFGEDRRPFFDDQYSWLRTNCELSSVSLLKYFGSGTLAADEVSCTSEFFFNVQPGVGQLTELEGYKAYNAGVSSWFYDAEDKLFGNKIVNWNRNRIALSKNVNGAPDYWTYKLDENDDDNNAIIIVLDGFGWGKQAYVDHTMAEGLRQYLDLALSIYFPGLQPSDIVFNPPLPNTYHNPIPACGIAPYKNIYGIQGATEIWPEYLFTHTDQNGAPLYSRDYEDNEGKYHIIASNWPTEFLGGVYGGDMLSAAPQFSSYWNQQTGFQETTVNVVERGQAPHINVNSVGNLQCQHLTLNYGGENIHRIQTSIFNNYVWFQSQYYNYDCSVLQIPQAASSVLSFLFGNQGFHSMGFGSGLWTDHRWNLLHIYSPESKKLITVNDVSATSATFSIYDPVVTVSSNRLLGDKSNGLRLDCNVVVEYPVSSALGIANNYIRFVAKSLSGADANVTFFKEVKYGSSEFPDSNIICIINERKNCGNLKNAAMGFLSVLNTDYNNTLNGYRAPRTINGTVVNYLSSALGVYQDAWNYIYTEEATGENLEILRNTALGGCVASTRQDNFYFPSGWTTTQSYLIVGSSKEDVIQKIDNFYENYDLPMYVSPKEAVPEVLYNYGVPFKAGKVF